jgi:DNA-binding XRE family transcriptional regulator
MEPYTVFTGDLVKSTQATPEVVNATLANIAATSNLLAEQTGQDPRFTRFRGDGWQMALKGRQSWYGALILILARLRAERGLLPTRISIAVGTVDTLGTRDLNDASGHAFRASGQGLDSLPKHFDDKVWIAGRLEPTPDGRNIEWATWHDQALVAFINRTARNWSSPQAEAVKLALEHPGLTQEDWARMLGISRQAFRQRAIGAAYEELMLAILAGENQGEPPYV